MVRNKESSVVGESFQKAFHSLLEDTNKFVKMSRQLPKDKLKPVAEKLLNRFDELMVADMGDSSRDLQKRYATHYRNVFENYIAKHMPEADGVVSAPQTAPRPGDPVSGQPRPTSS
jgi:hypothetical protein